MTIKIKVARKQYEVESFTSLVVFKGKTMTVTYPGQPLGLWTVKYGSGLTPLFHEDLTPILGTYKRPSGHKGVFQVMMDIITHKVITELKDREKGLILLQDIEAIHTQPGETRFW